MHFAFTGPREGTTPRQRLALRGFLATVDADVSIQCWHGRDHKVCYDCLIVDAPPLSHVLHHGCCVGSDAEMHVLAVAQEWSVVGHLPTNRSLVMQQTTGFHQLIAEPGDYMARNHAVVNAGYALLAAPKTPHEQIRSGTWATIRFARRLHKHIVLFWPDGTVQALKRGEKWGV